MSVKIYETPTHGRGQLLKNSIKSLLFITFLSCTVFELLSLETSIFIFSQVSSPLEQVGESTFLCERDYKCRWSVEQPTTNSRISEVDRMGERETRSVRKGNNI